MNTPSHENCAGTCSKLVSLRHKLETLPLEKICAVLIKKLLFSQKYCFGVHNSWEFLQHLSNYPFWRFCVPESVLTIQCLSVHAAALPLLFSSPPVVLLSGRASLSASAFTVSLLLSADDDRPKSRSSSATQVSRCCIRRCFMVGSRAGIGAPGVRAKSDDSRNRLTCREKAVFLVVATHFVVNSGWLRVSFV